MNHIRTMIVIVLALLSSVAPILAGNLDTIDPPSAGSGMPTTTDIYDRLDTGAAIGTSGAFREPSAGPTAGTGRTLAEIQAKLPVSDNANGAAASDVLSGKTFWGLRTDGTWGLNTGTIPSQGNVTGSNGSLSVPIPNGYYTGNNTATAADTGLVSGNIRSGASIFGVSGSPSVVDTSSANAVASNIASGRTAYVNGSKITGTVAAGTNVTGANGQTILVIPNGLYTGNKTATATDINLTAANIKPGVTIFGVTGQRTCSGTLNGTRWCDQGNGTVMDMTTGLVWLRDANCAATVLGVDKTGSLHWDEARLWSAGLANGICGLTDGSTTGDWRLPTRNELFGIVSGTEPVSSSTQIDFANLQADSYWTGTTSVADTYARSINMATGIVGTYASKSSSFLFVLPVRNGQ